MDQARRDPKAAATGTRSDGEALAAPWPEGSEASPKRVPEPLPVGWGNGALIFG